MAALWLEAERHLAEPEAGLADAFRKLRVLGRVEHVEPARLHRHGSGLEHRLVGKRVDAPRKARDDHISRLAQLACQPPRHARAERRGVARAHHGQARPAQERQVPQRPEDRRRVRYARERFGIGGIAEAQERRAKPLRGPKLGLGQRFGARGVIRDAGVPGDVRQRGQSGLRMPVLRHKAQVGGRSHPP